MPIGDLLTPLMDVQLLCRNIQKVNIQRELGKHIAKGLDVSDTCFPNSTQTCVSTLACPRAAIQCTVLYIVLCIIIQYSVLYCTLYCTL